MEEEKSAEALHLFFSGNAAAHLLERSDLGNREIRIIEAAIQTARSNNPDIETMREADKIIAGIRKNRNTINRPPSTSFPGYASSHETELGRLSSLEHHADVDPLGNPDSLLGYFYRDYQLHAVYGPALILLLILGLGWYIGDEDENLGERVGLNALHFSQARQRCRASGKRLPGNAEEVAAHLLRLREGRDRLGYWLRDGHIYYPLEDRTTKADEKVHLSLCLDPVPEKEHKGGDHGP